MYTIVCEDGTRIQGDKTPWHELPVGLRIKSLSAKIAAVIEGVTVQCADDEYSGFDSYGFQLYDLAMPDGIVGTGIQMLCVAGDSFLTVDINLNANQRRAFWQPLSKMTYRKDLLREGV